MTLTTEIPARTRDLQVRLDPAGKPLAIRHDGRIWIVDPATESRQWIGGDDASIEYWNVHARLGANSTLRTFTLRRNPRSSQWLLESVDDGS